MPQTVILGTARTPIGKLGGGLASVDATELGGLAMKAALERADVGPEQVQHVVVGQVIQAGQGQIPSRQAQIKAGIPKEVSSETINKVCASGMRAAGVIDAAIRAGDLDVGVAGGMESMSNAPYLLKQARFGFRMGDAKAIDAMINDGLRNPFSGKQMFEEAGEVADELEMTRPDLDRWALRSHELAIAATDEGRLSEEIVPVTVKGRKGDTVVEIDEAPRRDTTLETLAKLKPLSATRARTRPATRRASTTAAARSCSPPPTGPRATTRRSSPRSWPRRRSPTTSRTSPGRPPRGEEGAREDRHERRRRRPLGDQRGVRVRGGQLGPRPRHRRGQVNVNGGAVALGHPIGASGARIIGALVHELRRRGGGVGVAAICSGGGQGDAVVAPRQRRLSSDARRAPRSW